MLPLARAIVAFHARAERRPDHGGAAAMAWVIDGNARGFEEQGRGILDRPSCARLTDRTREELERQRNRLDARQRDGLVRQCHGDLHLRNLVLIDERPTLFDAIEFNDRIACIDVAYDLAFLLMDLWRRDLHRHANTVFNAWISETGDLNALPLFPLFLSCRAAVRAKTSATSAAMQTDPAKRRDLESLARQYLEMATGLLDVPKPRLIAVGGLSGSGKSTVARAIAPDLGVAPGALILRSDEIRKRLLGVEPTTGLGPEGYTRAVTTRVYETMARVAAGALAAGRTVIADAVHGTPGQRTGIEGVAREAGVSFTGLWLEASESVLLTRVDARPPDVSDADGEVVRRQSMSEIGDVGWLRLATSLPEAEVAREAAKLCEAS
jgi:predicted kinase